MVYHQKFIYNVCSLFTFYYFNKKTVNDIFASVAFVSSHENLISVSFESEL